MQNVGGGSGSAIGHLNDALAKSGRRSDFRRKPPQHSPYTSWRSATPSKPTERPYTVDVWGNGANWAQSGGVSAKLDPVWREQKPRVNLQVHLGDPKANGTTFETVNEFGRLRVAFATVSVIGRTYPILVPTIATNATWAGLAQSPVTIDAIDGCSDQPSWFGSFESRVVGGVNCRAHGLECWRWASPNPASNANLSVAVLIIAIKQQPASTFWYPIISTTFAHSTLGWPAWRTIR